MVAPNADSVGAQQESGHLRGAVRAGEGVDRIADGDDPINLALAEEPLKVAFVYVGPVGDAGWTYAHDQGRQALEKALGL